MYVVFDCNGIYVGAYCIRPVCHRINRIANHRHDIAKSAQFRAYAIRPYKRCNFLISYRLYVCNTYRLHPVCHRMNRIANHRHDIAKSAQFRAYAIRPYGGTIL